MSMYFSWDRGSNVHRNNIIVNMATKLYTKIREDTLNINYKGRVIYIRDCD